MPKNLLAQALKEVKNSKTSTRSLVNNPAFRARAEMLSLGGFHSTMTSYVSKKDFCSYIRSGPVQIPEVIPASRLEQRVLDDETQVVTINDNEEAILRKLNKNKSYTKFMEDYFVFLINAKGISVIDESAIKSYSLQAAEAVYYGMLAAKIYIHNPKDKLISKAMAGLKKDYPQVVSYINKNKIK